MPNIKPLRRDYQNAKLLSHDETAPISYKKLVNLACDGEDLFISDLGKANFNTFTNDTHVKCLLVLMLSYGLKTDYEEDFKKYILSQYSKGDSSIFNLLLKHDVARIKQALQQQDFQKIFKLMFRGDENSAKKTLTKIINRVGTMNKNELPNETQQGLLESLIKSLIEGKQYLFTGEIVEDD